MNNGELVHRALTELFVKRDVSSIERNWGNPYLQHNPGIADGHDILAGVVKSLGPNFKYEIGKVVADGEWVMVHGRYTGLGPKPMVGVDIFRVKDGKLVEHWDVLQEEVPASAAKSGRPMFTGTKRNNAIPTNSKLPQFADKYPKTFQTLE